MYWWLNDEKKPNTHPFLFSLGRNVELESRGAVYKRKQ